MRKTSRATFINEGHSVKSQDMKKFQRAWKHRTLELLKLGNSSQTSVEHQSWLSREFCFIFFVYMQIPEPPALRFWFYRPDMCPRDHVVFLFLFFQMFLKFFWWLARFSNRWIKPHIITVILVQAIQHACKLAPWEEIIKKSLSMYLSYYYLFIFFFLKYRLTESCKNSIKNPRYCSPRISQQQHLI